MAGIFKAYDIRGIYGDTIDEETAFKIGRAFGQIIEKGTIVIGRDTRLSAPSISKAVAEGITEAGLDVVDTGLCSTPMNYFAVGFYGYDGAVMITASHNPPEYIGAKFCRADAVPMSYETGINEIERIVTSGDFADARKKGAISTRDINEDYQKFIQQFVTEIKSLKVVIDPGHGMGSLAVSLATEGLPLSIDKLYFNLDGNFPDHEPDPLKEENIKDLMKKVKENGADLGVAFDGDADRIRFVDEKGDPVPTDIVTALVAVDTLKRDGKQEAIVYDLRSSWIVPEEIERAGGVPVKCRVGHSYIKAKMREVDAVFGGELAGHYYYKETFTADSSDLTLLRVLEIMTKEGKPLSEILRPFLKYWKIKETNFEVSDKEGKMKELAGIFSDGKVTHIDGVSVDYEDWWFNVRPSNTEPLLRLNLEARTKERMDECLAKLEKILAG